MPVNDQYKWRPKNLYRGLGIRVAIKEDIDAIGEQKYRPGIIIKTYPSHIMVQLLSSQPSDYDYWSFFINNRVQYLRPIYFRTIKFDEIVELWRDDSDKIIRLKKNSTFFTKVAEMQFQDITRTLSKELNEKENTTRSLNDEIELE